jgi:hypothetical protein
MTARAYLLAFVLPAALAGTACDVGIAAGGPGIEATFDRDLTVSGPVELDVVSGSGDITVQTGPAGRVHVQGRVRAWRGPWISFDGEDRADEVRRIEQNPPIEQTGDRIRVGLRDRGFRLNGVSITYVITVPADARVEARSGSGDLEVGDLTGPVDVSTGSGDIRIGNTSKAVVVRTGSGSIDVHGAESVVASTGSGNVAAASVKGNIEARSGSGDITVSQTAEGSTQISTGSGDINVTGARGPLRVRAASGDVSVEGVPAAQWDLSASSGDVRMRLPGDAAFDLDLHSGSGSIDTSMPVTTSGRQSRRELRGQVRGGGPLVQASTSSGSIYLR